MVFRLACIALVVAALGGRPAAAQRSSHNDLAIVVHPGTPVSDISFADLRRILRGERQYWTKDLPIVLLIRAPAASERDAVLKAIYDMSEPQFKQFWIAKIFRAETSSPPKLVYSTDTENQLVGTLPGAIAFMAESDVRGPLKVLKIDGHLPGDPEYRLHLTGK